MANTNTNPKKAFYADSAIEGIMKAYPQINAKDVTLFAPVYYPIADIEIDFDETSFEDFESVQITVLKLINLGHTSPDTIAALMGLTSIYVEKIIKLLLSFGHIDKELRLTTIGKESIEQGKKITTVRGAQRFQLDALGLNLIRLDKKVTRKSICDKEEISNGVLILDFADAVSKDKIISELKSENFRRIMASKSKLLNVNISNIYGVKCVGIRYVQAYVLILKGREPIFFSEREDFRKTKKQRFTWLPFSAISESTKAFLGIDDLSIYPYENASKMIYSVKLLLGETKTEKTRECLHNVMDGIVEREELGFRIQHIKVDYENALIEIKSKNAFSKVNLKTVSLLKTLADNGFNILTNKNLRGIIIKIFVSDKEVLMSLDKLNKILEKQGSEDTGTNIKLFIKKIENNKTIPENANIIDIINEFKI